MKKIIGLIIGVAAVIGLVASGTWALFTDTEGPQQVQLGAGTVDIAVDGENPWTGEIVIDDLKPCEVAYVEYVITNVGENPVVVYKHLRTGNGDDPAQDPVDPVTSTGILAYPPGAAEFSSEPECVVAQLEGTDLNDIHNLIRYDLSSEVTAGFDGVDPTLDATEGWHQIEYDENVFMGELFCESVVLGSIMPGGSMHVIQSYHLDGEAGNIYQGDCVTFYVQFEAVQIEGTTLLMENKHEADEEAYVDFPDDIFGTLDYNAHGPTFDYTFYAQGLAADTDYKLIYYADPWPGNNPGPSKLIANLSSDGSGVIASTSDSVELNTDLPGPNDNNAPQGAKIWLVLAADASGVNPGDDVAMTDGFNELNYLFETHTIVYDDTDVP